MSIFKVRNVGKNIQIVNPYITQPTVQSTSQSIGKSNVNQVFPSTENNNPEIVFVTKTKDSRDSKKTKDSKDSKKTKDSRDSKEKGSTSSTYDDDDVDDTESSESNEKNLNKTGENTYHPFSSLLETIVPVIIEQKVKKYFFIDKNSTIQIPMGIKEIFVSLVGGGGAGGIGSIKDNISFSGGGGGSGNGFKSVSIKITNNSSVYIECVIGKGGSQLSQAGEDTVIRIMVDGREFTTLVGGGGEPGGNGINNKGGLGGILNNQYNVRAKSGMKGSSTILTCSPIAGNGGASLFSPGGKGGSYNLQDPLESFGKYGSGGAGKIPTTQFETPNPGGDGFVIVEYIE